MLGKLTKHDFISMGRFLLPLYAGAVLLSAILSICGRILANDEAYSDYTTGATATIATILHIILVILIVVCAITLIAAGLMAVIVTFRRYYMNLFSDEGYLTFTLPVSTDQLLLSKTISASVATVATAVVAVLSVLLASAIGFGFADTFSVLGEFLAHDWHETMEALREAGVHPGMMLLGTIIMMLVEVVSQVLLVFLAITCGAMISQKHKILMAVVVYIGITTVVGIITSVFTTLGIVPLGTYDYFDFESPASSMKFMWLVIAIGIVWNAILGAVFYLVNRHLLKAKLNIV